jgi:hypothetical protein
MKVPGPLNNMSEKIFSYRSTNLLQTTLAADEHVTKENLIIIIIIIIIHLLKCLIIAERPITG